METRKGTVMKLRISLVLVIATLTTCACGTKSVPTSSPSPSSSVSSNVVIPSAAAAYRQALDQSLAAANSTGLTELWSDATGALVTVVVQDPKTGVCAQADLIIKDTQLIDADGMMPSVLLAELDGLEANTGTDIGSVKSPASGVIEVANFIDDTHYVTTYTLDSAGRISSAQQLAEGELAATATFSYSITTEGATALSAVQ